MGKKGLMAIKIDLEKAYDRLNWIFIHEILMELSLPFDLVHLIMECITSNSMNILWNGELTGDFSPTEVFGMVICCPLIYLFSVSRD